MFLLMSRLVIGELGHAMPMSQAGGQVDGYSEAGSAHHPMAGQQMDGQLAAVMTDAPACPEGEGSSLSTQTSHHHAGEANAEGASGAQDCCKSGECECPCLHVPCTALDAFVLNSLATTSLRSSRGIEGLLSQRPSGLFRPPA